jgi:hypothetical protein
MGLEEGSELSRGDLRQERSPDGLAASAPFQPQQEQSRGGQRASAGPAKRYATAAAKAARAVTAAPRAARPSGRATTGAARPARRLRRRQWQGIARTAT